MARACLFLGNCSNFNFCEGLPSEACENERKAASLPGSSAHRQLRYRCPRTMQDCESAMTGPIPSSIIPSPKAQAAACSSARCNARTLFIITLAADAPGPGSSPIAGILQQQNATP
jgi:hypothetical protein